MINLPKLEYLAVISICQNSVLHSESYLHNNNNCQDLSVCMFVCRSIRHTLRHWLLGVECSAGSKGGARMHAPRSTFFHFHVVIGKYFA